MNPSRQLGSKRPARRRWLSISLLLFGLLTSIWESGGSCMQVETWPITKFIPYSRNPRRNDQAIERMMASINEFGFKVPILARSSGEVVDGHLRLKAARKLG